MAKGQIQRIYWDSCCFLAILNQSEHSDLCLEVLEQAERGDVQIVISSLTMGEVVRPKGSGIPLPRETREQVLAFLEQEYITLVNLDREIVRRSLDLCWDFGLKSRDALHVAAALAYNCDAFETLDQGILKLSLQVETMIFRRPLGHGQMEFSED